MASRAALAASEMNRVNGSLITDPVYLGGACRLPLYGLQEMSLTQPFTGLMWRAHSCVPRRESSRRLYFNFRNILTASVETILDAADQGGPRYVDPPRPFVSRR